MLGYAFVCWQFSFFLFLQSACLIEAKIMFYSQLLKLPINKFSTWSGPQQVLPIYSRQFSVLSHSYRRLYLPMMSSSYKISWENSSFFPSTDMSQPAQSALTMNREHDQQSKSRQLNCIWCPTRLRQWFPTISNAVHSKSVKKHSVNTKLFSKHLLCTKTNLITV